MKFIKYNLFLVNQNKILLRVEHGKENPTRFGVFNF